MTLGKMKGGKSSKDNQNRSAKALERDKKKIMLMDALIDLAREMAKKKAKERSMAKVMSKEKEKPKKFMKTIEINLLSNKKNEEDSEKEE